MIDVAAEETAFVITTAERGSVVGAIGLAPAHIDEGVELGFWIGKPYWGRGYATEAARALLGFAFYDLGVTQIVAGAFRENRASLCVLEKVGFEKNEFGRSELAPPRRSPKYSALHHYPRIVTGGVNEGGACRCAGIGR